MKALVVDDSSVMRRVVSGALARAGITDVEQAENGLVAVELCKKLEFDLVLMDWNMPEMDGYEALKAIRAAGKTMPIMMVTTESEKKRVVDAVRAGANGFVTKPFEPDVIVSKIRALVGEVT